ncbi:Hypothetical predicted protein [Mytilus galloprovincialis]|uniref:Uncharacterized protein n=1 Tax=Mytilus galloprovincialis TaxID=29158 RepID=A0A8B6H1U2_MYTGA|nr:Hypothetical predicted protein [Mytilus galloprovincialis]
MTNWILSDVNLSAIPIIPLDSNKERWISDTTWNVIEKRRSTKSKYNQARSERLKEKLQIEYSELNKEVKKKARKDKLQYIEGLANEAEEACKHGELSTVYKITKQLCGKSNNNDTPVLSKNGERTNQISVILDAFLSYKEFRPSRIGKTEFPCQFPCPWHNKTFDMYSSVKTSSTWRFTADGQAFFTSDSEEPGEYIHKCYQITERFIIVREADSRFFRCYPIYYNPETPLEFIMGGGTTGPPTISTLSLDCTRPSACSPPGKVCNPSDTIPKACPTTATPTITADPKTKKSGCGKKKHTRP